MNCTSLKRKTVCYTRAIFVPGDKSLPCIRNLISARAYIHMQRVDYRMGHPGLESQQGPRILSSPKCPNRLWGHPSSYSVGTEILSTAVNRPRRMADHSYLAQRLIISGAVPPFPLYTVMACIGTTIIFYTHTPKSSNETQN